MYRSFLASCLVLMTVAGQAADDLATQRATLVKEVSAFKGIGEDGQEAAELDPRVLAAMGKVPREKFVPEDQAPYAYENRPLPIGYGQTISQPRIVAIMTDLLKLKATDSVLEIGTGSGYQASILSEMAQSVYSIEIIEPLAAEAAQHLQAAGYAKVNTKVGDGYFGWPEHAPFDAIIVTAVASHVPPPLVQQLKTGGRMVVPVGAPFMTQHLMLVEKQEDGSVITKQLLPVKFVPLTGAH